jgi:hypothetical protein
MTTQQDSEQYAPRPWRTVNAQIGGVRYLQVLDARGWYVLSIKDGEDVFYKAHVALAIRAVNAYYRMKETLENVRAELSPFCGYYIDESWLQMIDAALKEEEQP